MLKTKKISKKKRSLNQIYIVIIKPQIKVLLNLIGLPTIYQYGLPTLVSFLSWTFSLLSPIWNPFMLAIATCAASAES